MRPKTRARRAKKEQTKLDSPVKPPKFKWTTSYSNEYFEATEDINDTYKKMLSIGKAEKVFCDKVCPMMTAKTKDEFMNIKKRINKRYWSYIRTAKELFKLSTGLAVLMYLEYFLSIVFLAFTNSDFVFAVIMGHTLSQKTLSASPMLSIFL